jgi:hypothetical protein
MKKAAGFACGLGIRLKLNDWTNAIGAAIYGTAARGVGRE